MLRQYIVSPRGIYSRPGLDTDARQQACLESNAELRIGGGTVHNQHGHEMDDATTPLMRQYQNAKKRYPDAFLLFRLGDFYELFYDDAVRASRLLQITLTARNKEKGHAIPMCGVPYHAAESYIARLIRTGHRVAICEQMEVPGPGKQLVKREVVRVVTPGTAMDSQTLAPRENNFLAAISRSPCGDVTAGPQTSVIGLAYADLSTGEFRATEFAGENAESRLHDELQVLRPREVLLARPAQLFSGQADAMIEGTATRTLLDEWIFDPESGARLLQEQFRVMHLDGFGLDGHAQAVSAAGAIVHYLRETTLLGERGVGVSATPEGAHTPGSGLDHLDRISFYEQHDALLLDGATVRNLELVEPLPGEDASSTLVATLDETATAMGARLLRAWILRPSLDRGEIEARLGSAAALSSSTVSREELHRELGKILDLERLTSRVTLGVAVPRDMEALRLSLEQIPRLRAHLAAAEFAGTPRLIALHQSLDELADVRDRIAAAIADDPPATIADAGIIRRGYHVELDELRDLSHNAKQVIAAMEERERQRTKIGSLKIRFNQIFGYYIEISKANLHLVPADYERKQTLVNAERYTAPELKEYERKILDAEEKILAIERRLYHELREFVSAHAVRLRKTAAAVAQLDVLVDFARLAAARNYVRPEFTEERPGIAASSDVDSPAGAITHRGELLIAGGRHAVMEKLLAQQGDRFVPNDLYFQDPSPALLLITGPNMGGKSTYLRQAALIVLMAQMGSFVPATKARLPLVDRIYTRIGASDSMARGRSTFLTEMSEVAVIVNTATPASLVLLDEVGRGTATFDGLSIAWAVVESLCREARPRTLFATHYHELTELEELLPGVRNLHVSVREQGQDIVFLRRVEPGAADRSYGIEVARLAGLPADVILRAREILLRHESAERELTEELSPGAAPSPVQEVMFTPVDRQVLEALQQADLDNLRPLDALNLLAALKKQLLK
jgi:DNA mismatch repair protein MutS